MAEQHMRQRVVKALRSEDAVSVENKVYPGTPDVNYIGGWVELKWLPNWPRDREAIVPVKHFTPQQRVWLKRRWRKGGQALVLMQVKANDAWLLFDGETAAAKLGRVPAVELYESCLASGFRLDERKIKEWLTRNWRG